MNAKTFLLWVLPAGLLVVGGIVLIVAMRRRGNSVENSAAPASPLTAEEEQKIARLLDSDPRTRL